MPPAGTKKLEPLYSVDQAAELTGLRPSTLRKLIWQRRVEVIRPGGTRLVRIPRSEVERLRQSS